MKLYDDTDIKLFIVKGDNQLSIYYISSDEKQVPESLKEMLRLNLEANYHGYTIEHLEYSVQQDVIDSIDHETLVCYHSLNEIINISAQDVSDVETIELLGNYMYTYREINIDRFNLY